MMAKKGETDHLNIFADGNTSLSEARRGIAEQKYKREVNERSE